MKYFIYAGLLFLSLQSCKKSSEKPTEETPSYINTQSGSSWTYHETNSSQGNTQESDYTVTSTANDTAINGKSYHIYNYSFGGNKYLNQTNRDYYEYADFADLGQSFERLYLKSNPAVNETWSQEVSFPIPGLPASIKLKLNNQVLDIGKRTVNSKEYENVVHVKTTVTSNDIPSDNLVTDIHSYFAPQYGMIENTTVISLDYLGMTIDIDLKTTLKSATLK